MPSVSRSYEASGAQIDSKIASHVASTDPHGDRNYADTQVATRQRQAVLDVRDYNSVQAAITAAPSHSQIVFPPGTYAVSSLSFNGKSDLVLRGQGAILTPVSPGITLFDLASGNMSNIYLDGLIFDGSSQAFCTAVSADGDHIAGELKIVNCQFLKIHGVVSDRVKDVILEGNVFDGLGAGLSYGAVLQSGPGRTRITGNQFRYLFDAIRISGNNGSSTAIEIGGNYFDGGFYTRVEDFSGATDVTYTSTKLTDSHASFAAIDAGAYVRVMPVIRTGTATISGNYLTDASATFISSNVRRGYIIKTGTLFAIVLNVVDETHLYVEEWLSNTTRLPTTPASSASYTVYRIVLGIISTFTGTELTVGRWFDFYDGSTVLPSAAAHYEVMKTLTQYNTIVSGFGAVIHDNHYLRGMADQIGCYASHSVIADNLIEDCQDMGITIESVSHCVVSGNNIRHSGARGIAIYSAHDNTIIGNHVTDVNIALGVAAAPYQLDGAATTDNYLYNNTGGTFQEQNGAAGNTIVEPPTAADGLAVRAVSPTIELDDLGQTANLKKFRLTNSSQTFALQAIADDGTPANLLTIDRYGSAAFLNAQQVLTGPEVILNDGAQSANAKRFRLINNSQILIVQKTNDDGSGPVSLMAIDRSGAASFLNSRLGIGVYPADAKAILELASTSSGFLPPRMTGTQRDAISTPPEGLVVYNTSTHTLQTWNGSAWI